MTGHDALKIAVRALTWAAAEERRLRARATLKAAERAVLAEDPSDDEIEIMQRANLPDLEHEYRSSAASAAGYRRGLVRLLNNSLRAGIDRPKLKKLSWEEDRHD